MAKKKLQTGSATIKASQLVYDFTIYPRSMVVEYHVNELAEALRAGQSLPPIVVEAGTFRVVDGFHRGKAYQRVYGADADVPVEIQAFDSPQDLFLECVRLNAVHGRRLTAYDHAHCIRIAEEFKITPEALAASLAVTIDSLEKVRNTKVAIAPSGEPLPIRRSVVHLAGKKLTKTQHVGAQAMGGMPLLYYTNQLITAFEHNLLPDEHPVLFERLEQLAMRIEAWKEKLAA